MTPRLDTRESSSWYWGWGETPQKSRNTSRASASSCESSSRQNCTGLGSYSCWKRQYKWWTALRCQWSQWYRSWWSLSADQACSWSWRSDVVSSKGKTTARRRPACSTPRPRSILNSSECPVLWAETGQSGSSMWGWWWWAEGTQEHSSSDWELPAHCEGLLCLGWRIQWHCYAG